MKLILMNGYPSPYPVAPSIDGAGNFVEAAGGITLTIEGVRHFDWLHTVTVEFEDFESFEKARGQTGWKRWDTDLVLEAETNPEEGYAHPAIVANVPYDNHPKTAYCGFILMER